MSKYYILDKKVAKKIKNKHIPLLYALSGFLDAGVSAGIFIGNLLNGPISKKYKPQRVLSFNAEKFVNYRDRRPTVVYKNGEFANFIEPITAIDLLHDKNGNPFLLLYGNEPDMAWKKFSKILTNFIYDYNIKFCIGFSGIPMPVPHTRPLLTLKTSTKKSMLISNDDNKGTWTMPASATTYFEHTLKHLGIKAVNFSIEVPTYFADQEFPQGSMELAKKISEVSGLKFDMTKVELGAKNSIQKFNDAVKAVPELNELVEKFEKTYDKAYYEGSNIVGENLKLKDLPTADEITKEIESFLAKENASKKDLSKKTISNANDASNLANVKPGIGSSYSSWSKRTKNNKDSVIKEINNKDETQNEL